MSKNFKTVREVTCWENFTFNGKVYDLSHLNAHWVEYIDESDKNKPLKYKFVVTYGFHCFTESTKELSSEELQTLLYKAPTESRPFNFERYELSKHLPKIIESLGDKSTLVCHAGYGNYATVKVLDSQGNEVNYFVAFAVFREEKKFRLHVHSAYPLNKNMGKIQKVGFFVIANNLLTGKKLPKPH